MKIKISKSQWEKIGKKTGWMKTALGNVDVMIFYPEPVGGYLIPVSPKYEKLLSNIYGVTKVKANDLSQIRKRLEEDGFTMMLRNPDELKPEYL